MEANEEKVRLWGQMRYLAVMAGILIIVIAVVLSSSEPPEPELNYTLFLYTDREEYSINEYVNITGYLLFGEDPVPGIAVGMSTWATSAPHYDQLETNEDGYFSTRVYIPATASEGLHRIQAVADIPGPNVMNESYFTVSLDGSGTAMA